METIRRAQVNDAAMLAELAARTFSDSFGADNRSEDLALHLTRSYGLAQQTAELGDPVITTLVVEALGEAIGFAQVRESHVPDCVTGPRPLEVMRFYVARSWHGQGVAQRLMAATIAEAERRGAGTLWLGVWERNARAQAFYRKSGFIDLGAKIFCVGTDGQTDRVMARPLSAGGGIG